MPHSTVRELLADQRLRWTMRRSPPQLIPGVGPAVPVLIAHMLRRGLETTVTVTTPFPFALHQHGHLIELVRQWNRTATWVRFEVEEGPGTLSVSSHIDGRSPGWAGTRRARRRMVRSAELHAASTEAWRWLVSREAPVHALEEIWLLAARQTPPGGWDAGNTAPPTAM